MGVLETLFTSKESQKEKARKAYEAEKAKAAQPAPQPSQRPIGEAQAAPVGGANKANAEALKAAGMESPPPEPVNKKAGGMVKKDKRSMKASQPSKGVCW